MADVIAKLRLKAQASKQAQVATTAPAREGEEAAAAEAQRLAQEDGLSPPQVAEHQLREFRRQPRTSTKFCPYGAPESQDALQVTA